MIDPYFYNLLPIKEKAELLCYRGDLIMTVSTADFDVSLYALDGQYVELYYSIPYCKIEEIKTIESPQRLDFYINNIELDYLI
jgi:hypothetical protein